MDNFNLDPVTVCCQKRPSHFEMAIARSVQMLEEVISSPILYLINNFKENWKTDKKISINHESW